MTCAYWEFLVHGEQLQAPIPTTNRVYLNAGSLMLDVVNPEFDKGINATAKGGR